MLRKRRRKWVNKKVRAMKLQFLAWKSKWTSTWESLTFCFPAALRLNHERSFHNTAGWRCGSWCLTARNLPYTNDPAYRCMSLNKAFYKHYSLSKLLKMLQNQQTVNRRLCNSRMLRALSYYPHSNSSNKIWHFYCTRYLTPNPQNRGKSFDVKSEYVIKRRVSIHSV